MLNECMLCFCFTLLRNLNAKLGTKIGLLSWKRDSFVLQYSNLVQLYNTKKPKLSAVFIHS